MSFSVRNVILVGAGDHLGPSIVSALTSDSHFHVSILTRHSSKSTFPAVISVHRVGDDYQQSDLMSAFQGQDAVVSTIATASVSQQKAMIDDAIATGVKRFVPSGFGSDTRNEKAIQILPQYFKGKRESVEYPKQKEREGLTWTAFVTGPFFEL